MLGLYSLSLLSLAHCKCFTPHILVNCYVCILRKGVGWSVLCLPATLPVLPGIEFQIDNLWSLSRSVSRLICVKGFLRVLAPFSFCRISLCLVGRDYYLRPWHAFCCMDSTSPCTLFCVNIILKEKAKLSWQCPVLCVPVTLVWGKIIQD